MELPEQTGNWAEVTRWSSQWSDGQRAAITKETNRILADPAFRGSKRCQALLLRLIEYAASGDYGGLKERTLGVEVFGRDPDYDTSADPVVRMTANEIRKRLAQSYQEPDVDQLVRIRLVAGAYIPKFEFVHVDGARKTEEVKPAESALEVAHVSQPSLGLVDTGHPIGSLANSTRSSVKWIWAAIAILAVLSMIVAAFYLEPMRSKDYRVWKPLLDSAQPLTLCVSDAASLVNGPDNGNPEVVGGVILSREVPANAERNGFFATTSMSDAEEAQKITTWLAMHGRRASLRGSSSINLRDLRQGPVVLIGGFNPWTLILLSNLRYSVGTDPASREEWIKDAKNPSKREWKISTNHTDVDYAIITRVFDLETGKWILSLGGLLSYGTQAAGDLLTDHAFLQALPDGVTANGNFQIVLKSNVINKSAGPPQVVAFYTW